MQLADFEAMSFDCYGTLIDWEAGLSAVLVPWARDRGLNLTEEQVLTEYSALEAAVEAQLDRARDERGKLQREIATMKRDAETSWAAERVENALLRERINDVAAEVVRLTSALEGPGSRIETILAETGAPAGAVNGAPPAGGEETRGSLADRIRALQSRASRLSPAR